MRRHLHVLGVACLDRSLQVRDDGLGQRMTPAGEVSQPALGQAGVEGFGLGALGRVADLACLIHVNASLRPLAAHAFMAACQATLPGSAVEGHYSGRRISGVLCRRPSGPCRDAPAGRCRGISAVPPARSWRSASAPRARVIDGLIGVDLAELGQVGAADHPDTPVGAGRRRRTRPARMLAVSPGSVSLPRCSGFTRACRISSSVTDVVPA